MSKDLALIPCYEDPLVRNHKLRSRLTHNNKRGGLAERMPWRGQTTEQAHKAWAMPTLPQEGCKAGTSMQSCLQFPSKDHHLKQRSFLIGWGHGQPHSRAGGRVAICQCWELQRYVYDSCDLCAKLSHQLHANGSSRF